ncbi:MAG TPA: cellulase family glycosylhydrolase, partial [Candidatus Dormibacteraeota bacterium]|nr:cellulase family glycosylhydrolase [Candidatus Dormibacteraeota bacterium]
STQGNQTWPDGINYFTDNNPPVGQTFTAGTNALNLASVAIKTAGLNSGNGYGTPASTPTYYLRIYSLSGGTATLLISFSAANPGFTDGDWLKWSGLNVPLAANATYAFSFGIKPSAGGWAALAVATNAYSGGEIATVPISGGTITPGGSRKFDAVFDLGFRAGPTNIPASMPLPMPTYGWNLGNTLEATWGVPGVSAAPFYTAANAGFNAVRIPCAWDFNATTNISGGVTNYPINPGFVAQVKQVVDWAIAAGMYVMINDHWDDGWLENHIGSTVDKGINAKMNSYWTQIANAFVGYDNHLLFAGANEPNVNDPAGMQTLMFYYQTFVNAVRAAGGNNTNRWLVLQGGGDTTWLNALPTDSSPNRLMVEYHCYTPAQFAILSSDAPWGIVQYFWGPAYHYSTDPTHNCVAPEEGSIDAGFQQVVDQYVSKGIPVLIGEFGAASKPYLAATNATESAWNRASSYYWHKYVAESARSHGLSPFFWSTPRSPFDWTSGAVNDGQMIAVLTGAAAPPPPNGAPYAPAGLTATVSNNNKVILSWTAGNGATSYNLYRAAQSGYESAIAPVVTGITGTSFTDTNVKGGTTYYYQVVGVNPSGLSGFSPEAYAAISGVNQDPAQFNFETDSQRWYAGGSPITGIATSTAQRYAGNQSLAVNFNSAASGASSVSVGNVAVLPGMTITFHVWIPSGHKLSSIQAYMQDHNWGWSSSFYGSFTPNAWNTLVLTVPQTAVSPFQNLGLQFATGDGWTNTCYIDSVSWNTPPPDFLLSASPISLSIKGGTNGTSAITVSATNGLNACYTLTASNLPPGVTPAFDENPNTGGTRLLTLTASNSASSGTTNVTIIATAGVLSHSRTIALTVQGQTNTPPILAPIANQTVNIGQTIEFTASATDTNQPPQTLSFALLAGPTNATLNAASGAFSFRPLVTQANSTNNVRLKVSDNGTPSMSATQSFAVVVNLLSQPTISNLSATGGQFSFTVSGQTGPDYGVQASSNLMQWSTAFVTNSPALPFFWVDTNSSMQRGFYRIKLGPPLP